MATFVWDISLEVSNQNHISCRICSHVAPFRLELRLDKFLQPFLRRALNLHPWFIINWLINCLSNLVSSLELRCGSAVYYSRKTGVIALQLLNNNVQASEAIVYKWHTAYAACFEKKTVLV